MRAYINILFDIGYLLTGSVGEPETVGPSVGIEIGQWQVLSDVRVMAKRQPKDAQQVDEVCDGKSCQVGVGRRAHSATSQHHCQATIYSKIKTVFLREFIDTSAVNFFFKHDIIWEFNFIYCMVCNTRRVTWNDTNDNKVAESMNWTCGPYKREVAIRCCHLQMVAPLPKTPMVPTIGNSTCNVS